MTNEWPPGSHGSGPTSEPPHGNPAPPPTHGYEDPPVGQDASRLFPPAPSAPPSAPPAADNPTGPHTGGFPAPPTGGFPTPSADGFAVPPTAPSAAPQAPTQWDSAPPAAAPPAAPVKTGSRKKWLVPLAVLLVAAVAATAFFILTRDPGVKDGDADVSNAQVFATDQAAVWEESLPEAGITKADGATCYYLVDEESGSVTKKLACGPVRRVNASTADVWDTYAFTTEPGSEGTVTAANPDEDPQVSQAIPSGVILVSGDGKEATVDGSGLAEPETPSATENEVREGSAFEVADADKGDAVAPGGETTIAGLGTQYNVDSVVKYNAATLDGSITNPAEGQEFYVVTLSAADAANTFGGTNELSFLAGSETKPISAPTKAPSSYLVSAPVGGPLGLVVTSDGRSQTLDLLTGQRTGDPGTETLYGEGTKTSAPGTTGALPDTTVNGVLFRLNVAVVAVQTSAYGDNGWAPDGQTYVTVDLDVDPLTSAPNPTEHKVSFTCNGTTANEGQVSCAPGGSGLLVTGTVASGSTALTLNLSAQMHIIPPGGAPYDVTPPGATISIPLPA